MSEPIIVVLEPIDKWGTPLHVAQTYSAMGMSTFRLKAGIKFPNGGSHSIHEAVRDQRSLEGRFKGLSFRPPGELDLPPVKRPTESRNRTNVGVATGLEMAPGKWLSIIDDDGGLEQFCRDQKIAWPLPETFTVISAGRGRPHYYFFTKEKLCTKHYQKMGYKLDVLGAAENGKPGENGSGGYGLCPGSTIDKRKSSYRVEKDIPIVEMPEDAQQVFRTLRRSKEQITVDPKLLEHPDFTEANRIRFVEYEMTHMMPGIVGAGCKDRIFTACIKIRTSGFTADDPRSLRWAWMFVNRCKGLVNEHRVTNEQLIEMLKKIYSPVNPKQVIDFVDEMDRKEMRMKKFDRGCFLDMIATTPMTVDEIAAISKVSTRTVRRIIKEAMKAGSVEVVDTKKVRGGGVLKYYKLKTIQERIEYCDKLIADKKKEREESEKRMAESRKFYGIPIGLDS